MKLKRKYTANYIDGGGKPKCTKGGRPKTGNGQARPRGMGHWLHKQWIATKSGAEQHKLDCQRMKAKGR